MEAAVTRRTKKPQWLRRRLPSTPEYEKVRRLISRSCLNTVCQEAKCPNQWECFSSRTATFMIMGDRCTRNCRFCSVGTGPVSLPDPEEPERVALAAAELGLGYVVVTSVTRDDLSDGGASFFAETISALKRHIPEVLVEVLVPDFKGSRDALETVASAGPDVLNHNIETVPGLYERVRPQAVYTRSLNVFRDLQDIDCSIPSKSGMMLGLGETSDEIEAVLHDLHDAGCRYLTLGQYLQPSKNHLPVERYVEPGEFDSWRQKALSIGFADVASGPFVRSSYKARELYEKKL